jgi:hypothetical protein
MLVVNWLMSADLWQTDRAFQRANTAIDPIARSA